MSIVSCCCIMYIYVYTYFGAFVCVVCTIEEDRGQCEWQSSPATKMIRIGHVNNQQTKEGRKGGSVVLLLLTHFPLALWNKISSLSIDCVEKLKEYYGLFRYILLCYAYGNIFHCQFGHLPTTVALVSYGLLVLGIGITPSELKNYCTH